MARKKVKLAYITSNSKRKETFRKRKNGILKKVYEISTLCGIEACAIIYDHKNNSQAEVWPTESGVKNVLSRFGNLCELERSKKMVDQEGFLRQSVAKIYDQLKKQREETRKKEMTNLIDHYFQTGEFNGNLLSNNDLNDLSSLIDENLKEVNQKMQGMKIEAKQEVGNGGEAMNGTEEQKNIGHFQGLMNGGDDLQSNIGHVNQGLETNMNDAQINYQHWPLDFSTLPFSYVNFDPNGF